MLAADELQEAQLRTLKLKRDVLIEQLTLYTNLNALVLKVTAALTDVLAQALAAESTRP